MSEVTVTEAIGDLPADKARVFRQAFEGQGRDPTMTLSDYLATIGTCMDVWLRAFPASWDSEASYSKVRTAVSAMMQHHPDCVPESFEGQLRESFKGANIKRILECRRGGNRVDGPGVGGPTSDGEDVAGAGSDGDDANSTDSDSDGSLRLSDGDGAPSCARSPSQIYVLRVRDACMRWAFKSRSDVYEVLAAMWGPSPLGEVILETPEQMQAIFHQVVLGESAVNVLAAFPTA